MPRPIIYRFITHEGTMDALTRTLIGVTASLKEDGTHFCGREYLAALTDCGAMPVVLPVTEDEGLLQAYVQALDGFVFTGGGDVDPALFGQWQRPACGSITPPRDAHELALARLLVQERKPVLGICRGVQVLNVALGGTLYQDIDTEVPSEHIAHRQKQPFSYASHPVDVVPGTLLHRVLGTERVMVNSLHHQAIHRPGAWKVCALAPDGLSEAAELPGHPFFLGVQWHPEQLQHRDAASRALFSAFVDACTCAKA